MSSFSCPITSEKISETDIIKDVNFNGKIYKTKRFGTIKISKYALLNIDDFCSNYSKRNILRGLLINQYVFNKSPLLITPEYLDNIQIPNDAKSWEGKWVHLLRHIEKAGGHLRKPIILKSGHDFIITFSDDSMEFQRLGEYLFLNGYIDVSNPHSNFPRVMMNVTIKDKGMEFLHQGYKHTVLNRLASNVFIWDEKVSPIVDKACELFFKENSSREEKRVACKSLADVIENIQEIKKRLNKYFTKKDTNTFFTIVNEYEIRHNHEMIKRIEFEEQLEWVFYSLLNTLITYYKLESKLSN